MDTSRDDLSKITPAAEISESAIHENVPELARIRDQFEELTLVDTAAFFTDKLLTLARADEEPDAAKREAYRMAQLLHEKEEYHRAAHFITSRGIHASDLSCRYLAAKCYYDCKEYEQSLEILTLPLPDSVTFDEKHGTLDQWKSSLELLKGRTYQSLEDRDSAKQCFLEALRLNVFCYEAFQAYIKFDMISKDEEKELLAILDFDKAKFTTDAEHFIKYFYLCEFNKTGDFNSVLSDVESMLSMNTNIDQLSLVSGISSSVDVRLNQAEQLYNDCKFKECYTIVSQILTEDLYNHRCLLLNVGCLMELGKEVLLHELSHKLVEVYPENAISWYAVGCYYHLTGNADAARKYFTKSTTMDVTFQPALLMFGHSFESEALHDQSMAVYLDLSKAMPGSYLPLLYVGVEYCHLNNTIMAERYINEALKLSTSGENLFVLHELAIVSYQKKKYETALQHFSSVYEILSRKHLLDQFPAKWEPLLNNMGHVCRKLGKHQQAISFHKQALQMSPQNASTYDSLGLVYSLMGKLQMACDFFQKALSLKRDDAFAMTMYNIVQQEIIERQEKETEEEFADNAMQH